MRGLAHNNAPIINHCNPAGPAQACMVTKNSVWQIYILIHQDFTQCTLGICCKHLVAANLKLICRGKSPTVHLQITRSEAGSDTLWVILPCTYLSSLQLLSSRKYFFAIINMCRGAVYLSCISLSGLQLDRSYTNRSKGCVDAWQVRQPTVKAFFFFYVTAAN